MIGTDSETLEALESNLLSSNTALPLGGAFFKGGTEGSFQLPHLRSQLSRSSSTSQQIHCDNIIVSILTHKKGSATFLQTHSRRKKQSERERERESVPEITVEAERAVRATERVSV